MEMEMEMEKFALVEKANHLAVHGLFYSCNRAEQFLRDVVPEYCRKGFYMDKTLTPDSFEVIKRGVK